jgi:hypothetical protein
MQELFNITIDSTSRDALKSLAMRQLKSHTLMSVSPKEIIALILENEDLTRQNKAIRVELELLQKALATR